MKFLYLAYGATWLIHIGYIALVGRRFRRLRDEMEELRHK
jgi:CcmD family protein